MPSLGHLDSKNTLNAMLNLTLGGRGALPPPGQGLLSNLTRLTDKAVLEYESARASLDRYLASPGDRPLSQLFRAFDHLETCLDAVHRAGLHADRLRTRPGPPRIHQAQLPTPQARERVRRARNAVQHSEERILEGQTGTGTGRPVRLIATSTGLVVGERGLYIRYVWLAMWITRYHDLVRDLIAR
jgi:hypothetical protein